MSAKKVGYEGYEPDEVTIPRAEHATLLALEALLPTLKREHYICDDPFHSCPCAPPTSVTSGGYPENECSCGAAEHNARVDAALRALDEARKI